jgi:hypothetical protein
MAGRQRSELFRASVEERAADADQKCTNVLLRKTCEGHFEYPILKNAILSSE